MAVPCIFEGGHVTLGRALPCHRPAGSVGALAHRLPPRAIGKQSCYFVAGLHRVAKGNENAAPVGQQFARMPIRGRDDRLAEAEAIGQRTRRHLRLVEIGRDIDVAH